MDRQEAILQLRDFISNYLKEQGLDLIEFLYRYEGRDLIFKILADRPEGGISLGECSRLNKEINRVLDEKAILKQRYTLEISSPGLDRPLATEKDFLRCINRNVKLFLTELINDKREIEGIVAKVEEDSVYIDTEGRQFKIPLLKIARAKQIV
ncbi:MAG: ribosome maturation factor RimP [Candidatus Omnitrophica bacterium]|nr:ribosome maturation factor RimP [Candidatus Omnitrophota bacterium]MBU4345986.1 ribosome maturation factor RimP [Candidatus Omnitrophota bacterium]MBU4472822.1 ribosome maturation factor RimP [Candidatus Omnitrophota bacterium]MCG2706015.1 ribosome maturation factor RimP [Candidatus Omnitrophota bacterium]